MTGVPHRAHNLLVTTTTCPNPVDVVKTPFTCTDEESRRLGIGPTCRNLG